MKIKAQTITSPFQKDYLHAGTRISKQSNLVHQQDSFVRTGHSTRTATPSKSSVFGKLKRIANSNPKLKKYVELSSNYKLLNYQLSKLSPEGWKLFGKSVDELEKLSQKKINGAQYFSNVVSHAAELSPKNGEKFVQLLVDNFSQAPNRKNAKSRFSRMLAGNDGSDLGEMLQTIYSGIYSQNGNRGERDNGFHPSIIDSKLKNSTVSHHFAELLSVGFKRGRWLGKKATLYADSPKENPGDVRNGFFGVMVGSALSKGELSPKDAAKIIGWSLTSRKAPWSKDISSGSLSFTKDYQLAHWVKSYNKHNPHKKIKISTSH